jgi:cytochrome d ubiquinol oxidase subunit II
MGAVATVVFGWGVAQYPYVLPTSMTLSAAAAPDATLWSIVVVFVIAAVVILPSLGLLYYLDQRDLLAVAAEPEAAADSTPS